MSAELFHRDGRIYMICHCSEFIEDDDGGYFKHYDRERDITETADRKDDLCKICNFGNYPDCLSWCTHH